jgi:mitochondrial FAD-linked sulfhydryl oxidase
MSPMMDKSRWGPALWRSIHTICRMYPQTPSDKDKAAYKAFLERLADVIPCDECASNYQKNLRAMQDGDSLFAWSVRMHNAVNHELGRKSDWTVDAAMRALNAPDVNRTAACWAVSATVLLCFVLLGLALRARGPVQGRKPGNRK